MTYRAITELQHYMQLGQHKGTVDLLAHLGKLLKPDLAIESEVQLSLTAL